ncbi:MAG: DUF447 family protein [Planctomycetia bacterium]|nr:DUF447 family protein [Planctomycetia bacterium]
MPMPLVLEGIVTTTDEAGGVHLAPMGPLVEEAERAAPRSLVLRPFATSRTAAHLARQPAGVFHVTDDCLLLARLVTGRPVTAPVRPATVVAGWVLADCCRALEFEIRGGDRSDARQRLPATVVHVHEVRPFFGWNRAAAAVIEGAVHVTRLALLGADEVGRRLDVLAVAVEKTGGAHEREAFNLLVSAAVAARYAGREAPPTGAVAERPIP